MDPLTIALIGAGVNVASSLIGAALSSGDYQRAEALLREAAKIYDDVPLPGYEDFKDQVLGPSAFEGITADPRAKEAQYAADTRLRELADSGGMLLSDRAAQAEAMGDVNRTEQAARSRILARMRGAGQAGSGAEIQALLASGQDQANRAASIGLNTAGNAQRRALDAILERGRLGGQMRSQDWQEKSAVASARDEMNKYNAAARERGQAMRNQLATQRFQNDLSLRDRRYGAQRERARDLRGSGQETRAMGAGIGEGLGQLGALFGYAWDDITGEGR